MNWAAFAIDALKDGQEAQMRPRGNSMAGRVESGDLVKLKPAKPEDLQVGDIVLVRVNGKVYLHLIKAKDGKGRFQIGNNKGRINGWVGPAAIYGKAVEVAGRALKS